MKIGYTKLSCFKCENKFNMSKVEIKKIEVDHEEEITEATYICPNCSNKIKQELKEQK